MDIHEKIKNKIETNAKKYLENIDQLIDRSIEDAILSLIGLERSSFGSSRYEIDHCNGRNSVLIDAFRNKAIKQAEKLASQLKLDANEMKQYRIAFRTEYSKHIREKIRKAAQERAENDAKALIAKIKTDATKYLD